MMDDCEAGGIVSASIASTLLSWPEEMASDGLKSTERRRSAQSYRMERLNASANRPLEVLRDVMTTEIQFTFVESISRFPIAVTIDGWIELRGSLEILGFVVCPRESCPSIWWIELAGNFTIE
jgi:hypothetical protein